MAQRIIAGQVPEILRNKKVFSLDMASILAGTAHRGQFEARLKDIIKEVSKAEGQIILFMDEVHTLIGAGAAEGAIDAANMLKPSLARGELQMIGATTLDEYKKHIEKDAALARRFQSVFVCEPTVEDTISILRGLKEKYEVHHGVRISDAALVASATLSYRYIADRFLPDKAIDLMDEAASRLRMEGLVVFDDLKGFPAAQEELSGMIERGEVKVREHRYSGLESVPQAFIDLFTENAFGRRIIQIGPDPA